jgi:hypothetical protein
MARGAYLREQILPLLEDHLTSDVDEPSRERFEDMKTTYTRRLSSPRPTDRAEGPAALPLSAVVQGSTPVHASAYTAAGLPSSAKPSRRSKRDMSAEGAEIFARLHHPERP